ncbi:MAG TPA: phosphate signaling complex protein PhoU [Chloroflexota bacterium]|nr:phosphate signaling complex protein PhoU [Chloroflexota bacterium]
MAVLRESYHRDLQSLHDEVLVLGKMVEKAIERSVESLANLDFEMANKVIEADRAINLRRFHIEDQAIRLIATQQPMASDLRQIVAILNIVVDLERIGDYAVGNARITLRHQGSTLLKPLVDLPRMAEAVSSMLQRALDAMVVRDAAAAKAIAREDDVVDALYDQTYRELLTYMMADPTTIDRATWLLWAAHNLERAADRVTNVCERIVYEVTGRMEEVSVSTY